MTPSFSVKVNSGFTSQILIIYCFLIFNFCGRFLDFGLLCQMEKKHQLAMLASIVHIVNGDWSALVRALTDMDVVRPGTNIRLVTLV